MPGRRVGQCAASGASSHYPRRGAAGHRPPAARRRRARRPVDNWRATRLQSTTRAPRCQRAPRTVRSRRRGRLTHTKSPPRTRSPHVTPTCLPAAWTACLRAFERELTPQQFATWIRRSACADEGGRAQTDARPTASCCSGSRTASAPASRRWRARPTGAPGHHRVRGRGRRRRRARPRREPAAATRPAPRPHRPPLWIARRAPARATAAGTGAAGARRRPANPTPPASIRRSPSRRSSPARPTSWPGPPACRSPTTRRRTTRCSSTAASGWARRT